MKSALVFCLLFFVSCSTRSDKIKKAEPKLSNERWINIGYLNCLKTNLPCYCLEKVVSNALIFVNDSENPFFLEYDENSDYDMNYLSNLTDKRLNFYSDTFKNEPIGTITFDAEMLYLIKNTRKETFVKIKTLDKNVSINIVDDVNSIYLDSMFVKIIGKSFSNLIGETPQNCSCNRELGNLNIIKTENQCFILEMDKDFIFIYEFFPKKEKSYPVIIDKKLLLKLNKN